MTLKLQDQQKLAALKRFFVLDHAPSEDQLGRIVRFTGELFGVKYAFLTLRNGEGHEQLEAAYGFDKDAIPADAILFQRGDGPSIPIAVADASLDSRFEKNPLVCEKEPARLFAGIPLKGAEGFTLGTLAIMDVAVQELNGAGMAVLADIGAMVEPSLQLVEAQQEREAIASGLSSYRALIEAGIAASSTLSAGPDKFSDSISLIGTAASCTRAALFLLSTDSEGKQTARCESEWSAKNSDPLTAAGNAIDFASEGLLRWLAAFADGTSISEEASGPFLSTANTKFVAAIPLGSGDDLQGFVLLDRPSLWTEAEASSLQLAFAPLTSSLRPRESETTPFGYSPIPQMVVRGQDGQILSANEAAIELFGFGNGPLAGRTLVEFAMPENKDRMALAFAQRREFEENDINLQTSQGRELVVRIASSPVLFEGKDASQLAFIDVSKEHRQKAELNTKLDLANEATRAKGAFLAKMSHEIRTSLTSILGNAEFLTDELKADQLQMAETIFRSSERLLQTLNSVMDMERLESAGEAPPLESVSVAELVQDTVRAFERQAEVRDLTLICEGTDHPVFAWADEAALIRILDNLVSNSLKFTEKGGIRIRLSSNKQGVVIEIQDTGIGMDEAFIPHVFDDFKRESSKSSRKAASSGLGMSLTKRLVELMGGEISVSSRKGQGSVFRVALRASSAPDSKSISGDGVALHPVQSAS